ncbi:hypothetical protein GCM10027405_30460 [Arthrobacter alkaliphilus]
MLPSLSATPPPALFLGSDFACTVSPFFMETILAGGQRPFGMRSVGLAGRSTATQHEQLRALYAKSATTGSFRAERLLTFRSQLHGKGRAESASALAYSDGSVRP